MNMQRTLTRTFLALLCCAALLLGLTGGAFAAPGGGDYSYVLNDDGTLTLTGYTGTEHDLYLPAELDGKAVSGVGDGCFAGRLEPETVHLPEGITRIGDYAFECCSALRKIYLPASLRYIGQGAFSGCAALYLVDLQEGLEHIGRGAFLCCDDLVQLELPATLRELGDFAFSDCASLMSVRFAGNEVHRLPDRLFHGCSSLARLKLPEEISAIGKRCFSGCEGLSNLYFGTPLTELGSYAFERCSNLSSLYFSTQELPSGLLDGCSSLSWFNLADGTLRIRFGAFAGSGVQGVSIPASVEEIEAGAFYQMHGSVSLDEENAHYTLIDGSVYTADGKTLLAFFPADPYAEEPQTAFVLPEGVERIASYALAESTLSTVVLPASLQRIDAYAFADSAVEELEIPAGVDVDPDAFRSPGGSGEEGGEEPDEPGEDPVPEIIGSVAGEKNLFREEDYAGYREITNEEFDAWAEEYMAYNASQGVSLSAATMPYVMRYKGEVIPHYMPMTAVQNRDPAMWAEAASFFGDDFEQSYLMMDHGLFTELSRGKMQDDLILYSGLYDSQLMAAAGTEERPTQQQLVDAIGTSFTDPIMISTTTDPGVAAGFGDTLFIIYASREAVEQLGAICIDAVARSSEKEILMNARAQYRILDVGNMAISIQEPWDPEPSVCYRGYVKVELLASEAPEPPEPPVLHFDDVPDNAYYRDAVYWAAENGITEGTAPNLFSPQLHATRAQAVTFLWRAAGTPEPAGDSNPFADVPEDAYYAKAVLWAVEQGITTGTSATRFTPHRDCNRGEIMTFLYRFAGSPAHSLSESPFRDVTPGKYFYLPVLWALDQKITTGISGTSFAPARACTRAEIVTFLYRHMVKAE